MIKGIICDELYKGFRHCPKLKSWKFEFVEVMPFFFNDIRVIVGGHFT